MQQGKRIHFLSDFHLGVPDAASSLAREKRIVAFLDEAAKDALAKIAEMNLAELFIVSNVALKDETPGEGAVVGAGVNFPGLTIEVTEATGTKCPRCWMHSLQANADGLCPRCAKVMAELGEIQI